jgi:SAM-dependent methyltransferase
VPHQRVAAVDPTDFRHSRHLAYRAGDVNGDVDTWLAALDERHYANLTQSEVTRALRALSSCYVERREKLASGGALDGAGKRAAFALFYGPQHFLITREISRALWPGGRPPFDRILDLGCGTGTAAAALALEAGASIEAFDLNPWAVAEANWTYAALGLEGRASIANIRNVKFTPRPKMLILAAYSVNELPPEIRSQLLERLIPATAAGASALVIEPIGRRVNVWWPEWAKTATASGGREDEWRLRAPLPPRQRVLAKGAGLGVQELTAKSLYMPGR